VSVKGCLVDLASWGLGVLAGSGLVVGLLALYLLFYAVS
jgi:hypothetical protein